MPVLGHRDLDLYKLFKIVSKMKGMDKVCTLVILNVLVLHCFLCPVCCPGFVFVLCTGNTGMGLWKCK